jgi:CRISPR-associated endonuclease/helicase Cas3
MSTAYRIHLKPVYSQTVATPKGLQIPENWQLSWHQVETWKALQDPNIDVVINTAMTGDGKSLAAYLPAMTNRVFTLAMYPTNELARDQERQVINYKGAFNPKYDPQIYRLNSPILEDFILINHLSNKQQGIINRVDNSEILLTNPDIFHYIHDFRYLRRNHSKPSRGENADKLFRKIEESYKLFIYDEFHVFGTPQIASVLNAMLLIKHTSKQHKFLFLSATPSEILTNFLERSGLRYQIIDPIEQGAYSDRDSGKDWRQIAQPIEIQFPDNLEPNARSGYEWIVENAESIILQFFLDYPHPNSKGAIILNSIASVYRLVDKLKPLFNRHGLTVMANTSLTGEGERIQSIDSADLLIGTSTIDVGVDFRINFLVFEAADAGNFIQRFGRLGRHSGFPIYQAYALIPNYLVARLFKIDSAPLRDGMECDRISFNQNIHSSWSFINQFDRYPERWGVIQSYSIWNELRRLTGKYPEAATNFERDINNALGVKLKSKYPQIKEWLDTKQNQIIDEARSFRSTNQLDCAIYDCTNPGIPERDRFKTYHLPGLLSNFTFEPLTKKEFERLLTQTALPPQRYAEALCYVRLIGYREVRENWHFYRDGDISSLVQSSKVQIVSGLQVTVISNDVNRVLYRKGILCYVSDRRREELRAKLGLPLQFAAYGFSDNPDDRSPPYTIAFGKSALMLENLTHYWKAKKDEGWVC